MIDLIQGSQLSLIFDAIVAEARQDVARAETILISILDNQSKTRSSEPAVLIHYLDFIRRNRGVNDSIEFFLDLEASESDHITPEVRCYVALCLAWTYGADRSVKHAVTPQLERILSKCKGKQSFDLTLCIAEFLGKSEGNLRHSVKTISSFLQKRKMISRLPQLWDLWESLLNEFGCSMASAVYHGIKCDENLDSSAPVVESLYKEEISSLNIENRNISIFEYSWFALKPSCLRASSRFKCSNQLPQSSLLEYYMDEKLICDDNRDGGEGLTNHVFRPDVTKMIRFVPSEDVQRKVEVPKIVKGFLAYLPFKTPKSVNSTTLAESCLRMLVSISLPKTTTEEMLGNVDKRARLAVEQSRRRAKDARVTNATSFLDQSLKTAVKVADKTKEEITEETRPMMKSEPNDFSRPEFSGRQISR